MDFQYSEEQRMLADSLRRFAAEGWSFEGRRNASRKGRGFTDDNWNVLAEMGVLGLNIPQEYDGFGENPASMLVVHTELGRALAGEPVIPSSVVCATVLERFGSDAQKKQWLPAIAGGESIFTLAYLEPGRRYEPTPASTSVEARGEGFVLNGTKVLVWHAAAATSLLVSAVGADGKASLFIVPRDAAGVSLRDYPTIDGVRAADITFSNVELGADALVGTQGDAAAALEVGIDHGIAALCAHAAGAMERLIEITAEYLRTRKQFGQPLGKFQALQHRMADMLIQKEQALSMAYVAVSALTEQDVAKRRRMISGAKTVVAEAGRYVGQQAVQLHGGMGMTDELEVGDYFKRLTMVDPLFGDMDYHTQRFSEHMA